MKCELCGTEKPNVKPGSCAFHVQFLEDWKATIICHPCLMFLLHNDPLIFEDWSTDEAIKIINGRIK